MGMPLAGQSLGFLHETGNSPGPGPDKMETQMKANLKIPLQDELYNYYSLKSEWGYTKY